VTDDLKDMNLASHALHICLVLDFVLFKYLNRHFLPREDVRAESHFAESALPEGPTLR
jgi:hypothetical protein